MEDTKEKDGAVLDDTTLEEDFNKALEDLTKSLEPDEDLEKAKKAKKPPVDEENEPESDESDEDGSLDEEDEDEEEKKVKKSLDDWMGDDEEAETAMDVEPFLRTLVKSLTTVINDSNKAQNTRINKLEKLVKSQSKLLAVQAKLQKSVAEKTDKIAKTPIPSGSIKRLQKARFGEGTPELNGMQVLNKSTDWLRNGKISLLEAGKIEGRINSGTLGSYKDALDTKIVSLLKEVK